MSQSEKKIEQKQVPVLVSSLGGGLGAMVGAMITSPLEVVKTRLQAQNNKRNLETNSRFGFGTINALRNLVQQEGFLGLYRGLFAHCLGVIPARTIHFFVYSGTKGFLAKRWNDHPYYVPMFSSAFAAATVVTITSPIWLVKTRLQLQAAAASETLYNGLIDCAIKTYKSEGLRGFYKGLGASYLGVFETMIQFTLYENLKRTLKVSMDRDLHSSEFLLISSFSKLVASALTYPHEVIRTRLREQKNVRPLKYPGPISGMLVLARQEGIKGLYGGMGAHLLRVVPNAAILFYVYEMTERNYLRYNNPK
jgi:solute carrier family 25 protein 33/36